VDWKIKVAKSWCAADLVPLVARDEQLHGISFSENQLEIYLKNIDQPIPLSKRMMFEILGQFFFCEGLNLIELKNNKFVLQAQVLSKWHR